MRRGTFGLSSQDETAMTQDIVLAAEKELEDIGYTPIGKDYKTGDVRKISAKLFKGMKGKPLDYVFAVCESLLEQRSRPMGVIAYDFAYRMMKHYDADTFAVFERWLKAYVRGWGDCDDFCTHAFGELICQNTELADKVIKWTTRDEFWLRRAAAVVLIPSIYKDKYIETKPLRISDILMTDEHDLVRKGYGWMLKVLSTKEPDMVFDYLTRHKEQMPRVSYRYALEKMDACKRRMLMQ